MNSAFGWGSFVISVVLLLAYELHAHWRGQRSPEYQARFANARVRLEWVKALSAQPGFEIVAVQALRNALMSATISASTAALALMGSLTLAGAALASGLSHLRSDSALALHTTLEALLVLLLFASYVCSAMAMRFYANTSFVMSVPVGSTERERLNPLAAEYVKRGGLLYGWGIRLFVMIAPVVAGIVHPYTLAPVTLILIVALYLFDLPASAVDVD